jgi:hypothetical protein
MIYDFRLLGILKSGTPKPTAGKPEPAIERDAAPHRVHDTIERDVNAYLLLSTPRLDAPSRGTRAESHTVAQHDDSRGECFAARALQPRLADQHTVIGD